MTAITKTEPKTRRWKITYYHPELHRKVTQEVCLAARDEVAACKWMADRIIAKGLPCFRADISAVPAEAVDDEDDKDLEIGWLATSLKLSAGVLLVAIVASTVLGVGSGIITGLSDRIHTAISQSK